MAAGHAPGWEPAIIRDVSILVALGGLVCLPLFFYLPGLAIERASLREQRRPDGLELAVMRVVASTLVCGWASFFLAEIGWWSLPALLAAIYLIVLPALLWGRRVPWPPLLPRLHGWDWAMLALALVFGALVARPFEVVRGGLDAGVYALSGIAIARTGGIVQRDPIVAEIGSRAEANDVDAQHAMNNFFGVADPVRFIATRLRAAGFYIPSGEWGTGRVVPQFFHLWPAWIAIGAGFGGPYGGLMTTGVWGLLGVLLLGLLGRRIAHPLVGLGAAAFLALNSTEVWFSRMPLSEALIQGLTLAGLWAFTHFADDPGGRAGIWWGVLTGAAIGQLALAKIDFFWAVGPLLLYLLYIAISRRWRAGHSAMAAALGLLLVQAALHVVFIARAYFFDTGYSPLNQISAIVARVTLYFVTPRMRAAMLARPRSALRQTWRMPLEIGLILVVVVVLIVLWRHARLIRAAEGRLARRREWLLRGAAVLIGVLAVYAYLVRPQIVDRAVLHAPLSPRSVARLQGYIGAPIAVPEGMKETVARDQANFVRFGWYVSPLGIVLGSLGAALLWWRGLTPRSWLFLLIASAYTSFYINSLYGTSDRTYIYILRRLVPMVYPAWSLAMAYALWWLARGRSWSVARRFLAAGLAAAMLLFFVFTGRNIYRHVEYGNALRQFEALASSVGPRDVVLVRGGGSRDTSDVVAGPLTYIYGRNALTFKGSNPLAVAPALASQVQRWTAEGRRVYALIGASGGDWRFPGWTAVPQAAWTWTFREFQMLQDQKPFTSGAGSLPFRLYRLVPESQAPAGAGPITPADTISQVSGFYRAEDDGHGAFAWTMGTAVLRLPAPPNVSTLALDLSAGPRPRALPPASVCVDIAPERIPYPQNTQKGPIWQALPWQSLGCHPIGRAGSVLRLPVPGLAGGRIYLVRMASQPWTPSKVPADPGQLTSSDERSLGVRWMAAQLLDRP